MKELMIHVERAVRPVRASLDRRLKMREELLAHLQGIYDEELERLKDHDAALRAAIERFGPVDDVSRKLQKSVPWESLAVWHFYRGFSRGRTRRPSVLDATWWMLRRMFVFWVVVGSPWIGIRVWLGQLLAAEAVWLWAAFLLYGFAVAWPLCAFLAVHLGILGQPKSTLRAFLFGIGTWCAYMTLPVLFWAKPWFGQAVRDSSFGNDLKLVFVAALLAVLSILIALLLKTKKCGELLRADIERGERAREWDLLELSG